MVESYSPKVTLRLEALEALVAATRETLDATGLKLEVGDEALGRRADEASAALEQAREQLAILSLGECAASVSAQPR